MRVRLPVGLLAGLIAASAATAPADTGLVGQRTMTIAMAQCAVRRDPVAAERFVLADFPGDDGNPSPAFQSARQRIVQAMVPCLGRGFGSATMPNVALRGFLAEALLTRESGAKLAAARSLPTVAPAPVAGGVGFGAAFWRCVVAAEPLSSADLIAAADVSVEESKAFDALSPALQSCAPSDKGVRIKPGNVRPQVAAALYRRVASGQAGA